MRHGERVGQCQYVPICINVDAPADYWKIERRFRAGTYLPRDTKKTKKNIMRNMASSGHRSEQAGHAPDFRLVINSTPALIHTGLPDGYLDFFNQTWLQYVGRPLEDLEGWRWTASIHPADVD